MGKNYYIILGVSREADPRQIKSAYRTIAKKLHPDLRHPAADPQRFNEIREAYETLADPDKRRRYDIELKREGSPLRVNRVPEIVRKRREPYASMEPGHSLIDEFFEGFLPSLPSAAGARAARKDLYLEVILSEEEAFEGGLFPIEFPVFEPCSRCGRSGLYRDFFCPECEGRGVVSRDREFALTIPPRTSHGTEVTLSLEDIGLPEVRLHLTVMVDPLA